MADVQLNSNFLRLYEKAVKEGGYSPNQLLEEIIMDKKAAEAYSQQHGISYEEALRRIDKEQMRAEECLLFHEGSRQKFYGLHRI